MLHCIECKGGQDKDAANVLVDSFYCAEILRKKNQEAFDVLTKVKFQYNDVGTDVYGEFHIQNERPIIG